MYNSCGAPQPQLVFAVDGKRRRARKGGIRKAGKPDPPEGIEPWEMRERLYFFCISLPQHLREPLPPLVTITCEPHLPQRYIFPIWFAMNHSSSLIFLLSSERGLSFRQEGLYSLRAITSGLQQRVQIFFQPHSLIERQVHCLEDGFFA